MVLLVAGHTGESPAQTRRSFLFTGCREKVCQAQGKRVWTGIERKNLCAVYALL